MCVCVCVATPSSITPPPWSTSCPSPLCTGKRSYHLNSVLMGWKKEKCGGFSPDGTTRCTPPLFFSIPKSLPSLSCLFSLLDFEPSWRRCFFLESAPESLSAALIISQLQLYTSNIHTLRLMDLKLQSSEELHNERVTLRLRLVDAPSQPVCCCSDSLVILLLRSHLLHLLRSSTKPRRNY